LKHEKGTRVDVRTSRILHLAAFVSTFFLRWEPQAVKLPSFVVGVEMVAGSILERKIVRTVRYL
jgi:hypothetical protein